LSGREFGAPKGRLWRDHIEQAHPGHGAAAAERPARDEAHTLAELIWQNVENPTQAIPVDPLTIIAAELRQWSYGRARQS
jgi:hypothetical protein